MRGKALSVTFMIFFLVCSVILFQGPDLYAQDFFADMFPGLRLVQIEQGQNFNFQERFLNT